MPKVEEVIGVPKGRKPAAAVMHPGLIEQAANKRYG